MLRGWVEKVTFIEPIIYLASCIPRLQRPGGWERENNRFIIVFSHRVSFCINPGPETWLSLFSPNIFCKSLDRVPLIILSSRFRSWSYNLQCLHFLWLWLLWSQSFVCIINILVWSFVTQLFLLFNFPFNSHFTTSWMIQKITLTTN